MSIALIANVDRPTIIERITCGHTCVYHFRYHITQICNPQFCGYNFIIKLYAKVYENFHYQLELFV